MITRCSNCGGKFDKDEAYEMDHCGGVYEELCEYCIEMLNEARADREEREWAEKVRQWDEDEVAEDLSEGTPE